MAHLTESGVFFFLLCLFDLFLYFVEIYCITATTAFGTAFIGPEATVDQAAQVKERSHKNK
ncbi:MAG: hypothetical protein ACLFUB_08275 [Cyclobacteriaceae bacterium]